MKLAVVIPSLSGGGAESIARRWASALTDRGNDVDLLLLHPGASSEQNQPYKVLALGIRGGFVRSIFSLRSHILRENYDSILTLMPYANLIGILAVLPFRGKNRPKVTISEHTVHKSISSTKKFGHRIQLILARHLYQYADEFIAVSHAVATQGVGRFRVPKSRLWVLPNSIASKLPTKPARRSKVATLPTISIVLPCRLVTEKRPQIAIEVARLVQNKSGKPTTVHFYGAGPLMPALETLANSIGVHALFHGWVENWTADAPDDGIVLLPSNVEGFGNVLVEAALAGIPAVASSRSLGVADACINGMTGVLAVADTSDAFAAAVLEASSIEIGDVSNWLRRFTEDSIGAVLHSVVVKESTRP